MSKQNIIVLDLETKRTFEDVGGRGNLGALGVSMVGVYSYRHIEYPEYFENDFPKLFSILSDKPLVIGFTNRRFDMPVLQPYFKDFDLKQLKLLDVMEELTKILGHRIGLDAVAQATLGTKKSGHGLDAIRYWNTGDLESLKKYCLDDVRITKEVYEYGAKHGELFFMDKFGTGKIKVAVNWKMEEDKAPQETTKQFSLF